MRNKSLLLIATAVLFVQVGCKKKGDFTTDKDVYKQGEVITVTNTTEKEAKYYSWTFGGASVEGENPVYTLPEDTPVGSFEISVLPKNSQNTSDSWKRTSMSVTIEEAEKAQVIFYLPFPRLSSSNETISVEIDGVTKTASVNPGTPSCDGGNVGVATFNNLPSGEYSYSIFGSSSSGSYTIGGFVTLENGFSCERINVATL